MSKNNSRIKENLKLGASTLISNDACIEISRTRPWYGAVIAAFLAIAVAIIPTMVQSFKVSGGDVLNTPTYSIDRGLIHFQEALYNNNVDMIIDPETDKMSTPSGWTTIATTNADTTSSWKWESAAGDGSKFEVFWTESYDSFKSIAQNSTFTESHAYSYMVFFPDGFVLSKTQASSGISGQYDRIKETTNLKNFGLKDLSGNTYQNNVSNKADSGFNSSEYEKASLNTWKTLFTDCYETIKITSGWKQTGLIAGIYAVFVIFMGLLLFLMTRGKQNPYRTLSFWETQKISYWASFAPAVVGMIISFVLSSSMVIMGFIFAFGMRVMWLTMKTASPAPQKR